LNTCGLHTCLHIPWTEKGNTVSDTVLYEKDAHIVTITYHRPKQRNAINGQMREELNAAWLRFRDDEDAWVAIVTGTGPVFSAGADIKEGGAAGTFAGTFWEKPTINSFESGLELFKPTIAAINGPCLGYGVTAVSFCDFVIASEKATFGFPEVRIGVPTIVGAIRMPQRLLWADAMELLLIGEAVDAQRAREMGLVWKVVPHDTLITEARTLAERLCKSAPLAVRATKEVAVRTRTMPWVESVRFGETMRIVAGRTEDVGEARQARQEKREPEWKGK